jgi:hypothetical protein
MNPDHASIEAEIDFLLARVTFRDEDTEPMVAYWVGEKPDLEYQPYPLKEALLLLLDRTVRECLPEKKYSLKFEERSMVASPTELGYNQAIADMTAKWEQVRGNTTQPFFDMDGATSFEEGKG